MKERIVEVTTPDGKMPTFVTHPEAGGPFPAVVVYMDIWGVREELFEIARRIATVGYCGVVPDFYYRQGKIGHLFRDDQNRMVSFHNLDAETEEKVMAPMLKLSDAMVMSDTDALISFFKDQNDIRDGAAGCIGYCMGGRHVFCAAGHFPDIFAASACLHGTALITEKPDSPHLVSDKLRGELYCGYGELDPYTPTPLVTQMAETFAPLPAAYRYEVHAGADHGYALPDRDIFDARAAARDWEIIFAMYRRQLQP